MARDVSDARIMRLGIITLVVMALISAATFNLSKFPGFRGTTYYAEFSDASGIHKGNMVQVGGLRVGRVTEVSLAEDRVVVKFEINGDVDFGPETTASVEVLNLLGEKFLDLQPLGEGELEAGDTIPLERTEAAYDIVGVFGDLATTTEEIDTQQLAEALNVVSGTLDGSAPEIGAAFDGIARLSRSVSQRDEQIQTLFESSQQVTKVLERRGQDIVDLMRHSDLVFKELRSRKAAVHRLLVNARVLADELRGLAEDNEEQIGPALAEVDELLTLLVDKRDQLKATLHELGPYVDILSNIIGTGPWFDAVAINLLSIPTGEFQPGFAE
ncbi:MlaD family protein [Nocardioides bizhenqiangii]|uniref:MlaD family protein n=1 Tax=Nocardioides bizhenqiangii TaxID=3095076 RepID=A0ABZ0ZM64_9ACTN|nr:MULTISPECIES: MlaD family protein [unclassified Nocardioides]MDZ5620488.1 MlaD family protein [Nocardioides sp. HM23]WQQ24856.1 MlaD family protein [Nocardioides sp. HM61]